jgi:hypothetical protein
MTEYTRGEVPEEPVDLGICAEDCEAALDYVRGIKEDAEIAITRVIREQLSLFTKKTGISPTNLTIEGGTIKTLGGKKQLLIQGVEIQVQL